MHKNIFVSYKCVKKKHKTLKWFKYNFHITVYIVKGGGGGMGISMDMADKEENRYKQVMQILPVSIRKRLMAVFKDFSDVQEIRLRTGRPLIIIYNKKEYFLGIKGGLSHNINQAYLVSADELKESMDYISNYSRYAFEEELRQGYITVQGGHRIGVAGKTIWEQGRVKNMNNISFINIRIAHQVKGCSEQFIPYIKDGSSIFNTLIVSPPRCGKTTLLRDMIRVLADGDDQNRGMTVGVVDERSEIGACYRGCPQNDLGCRSDILDGCQKAEGMMMLVRSMSPEIIAVDEIGSKEDTNAIDYVMNCGIRVIATVHGMDMNEIRNKPVLGRLVKEQAFKRYILLEAGKIGRVSAVFDERGTSVYIPAGIKTGEVRSA